jgi:hypothetical protein
MKLIKLLGVALAVVLGLLAATSSASATTLCLKVEDPCSKANIKSKLSLESTNTAFEGLAAAVCARHTQTSEILPGTLWDTTHLLLLHFKKCSGCTNVTGASKLELGATGGGNGVYRGSATVIASECAFGEECVYGGEGEKLMTLIGSETNVKVEMVIGLVLKKGFGALCGEEGVLTGTFTGETEVDKKTSVSKKP